ncbi:hypothetical protein D9619_008555 [Psilocybe cf. subviscida]|uniref:DUF4484 domain-containing protein n=1 Tax=Psilocybe cf. subviscida TaxID=2480587 RepID=A0A8H5BBZ9_9AGAR|nr:hypothetical protein D9619_008555 [Psilocybe cf. subviscida]
MTDTELRAGKVPQDLVAIFHVSFHPTKGNTIDWSQKTSDDLSLEHIEFNALPSGLHLVEQDVVYFTKDGQHGVCVFRRRQTNEAGHRGVRLGSLGILLAKSHRPRPWRHVGALKDLLSAVYGSISSRGDGVLEPVESDWDEARRFFEERKIRRADLGGAGDWAGWSEELDGSFSEPLDTVPTLHLPHLLRIFGPSALTLYKHVIGRQRILIYTLPPVEAACVLCHVAADICFAAQAEGESGGSSDSPSANTRLKGRHREPINVLGMVTLTDIDRLRAESKSGRGYIACTTDAIFMDKKDMYDLFIDLTTSTPNKSSRPTLYNTKFVPAEGPSAPAYYKFSSIRFSWSDVKLWNEIDRILQLDSDGASHANCGPLCSPGLEPGGTSSKPKGVAAWTDVWRVYEDVCIICAGLWMGNWRGNSPASYSTAQGPENWGAVRLEGDDDLTINSPVVTSGTGAPTGIAGTYVRNVGMGIEGRPVEGISTSGSTRRASALSWSSGRTTVVGAPSPAAILKGKGKQASVSTSVAPVEGPSGSEGDPNAYVLSQMDERDTERRDATILTAMAVLQTFHAHTLFQLSVLEDVLSKQGALPSFSAAGTGERVVTLTPKEIVAFELGPLSSVDVRYLEWIVQEYAGDGLKLVIKRGWKDLIGSLFGYS